MVFITHLPRTARGVDSITTAVDRFSRRMHFVPSNDSDRATDTAEMFFNEIIRLHGLPDAIISDRDHRFTSQFWRRLMDLCDVNVRMSSSQHPQTDGLYEVMNRIVENYLRCYCSRNQRDWDLLLASTGFAFNSSRLDPTGYTPFELDLGWNPRSPLASLICRNDIDFPSVDALKKKTCRHII